jgi:hypothetical protein
MKALLLAAAAVAIALPLRGQEQSEVLTKTGPLTVHEWGTFTSVAGADGASIEWRPLAGPSDLPSFVYTDTGAPKGLRYGSQPCAVCKHFGCPGTCCKTGEAKCFCKVCTTASVRMETPVLYFYANQEMKVAVKVAFPQGRITEWYPQARSADKGIDWGAIRVLPGAKEDFPREASESHYSPARETDASPIRVCSAQGGTSELEKFLFYRGVGTFPLPVTARLEGDAVVVQNAPEGDLILFENRGGKVGCSVATGRGRIQRPALNGSVDDVCSALKERLAKAGLYEKEAAAMIKTWRSSWFEEGLRLFHLLPRPTTDAILPLTLDPAPDALVRVMVGRMEFITPEHEELISGLLKKLGDDSIEVRDRAERELLRQGRFAEPAMRRILAATKDPEVAARIKKLLGIGC